MTKKFDKAFSELYEDYESDFNGYYSGMANNDLALNLSTKIGQLQPEIGDMVQVQIVNNLNPDKVGKSNSSNTYRIVDKKGTKITMVYCEMINGAEVETYANPAADLDSTYMNCAPAFELKQTSELTLDLSKLGKNTFNYMHDNIWTACVIITDNEKESALEPATSHESKLKDFKIKV